ncbi:DNA-binding XRE family transcriptional regulator [Bacillus sp. SORGH_AS 510]|uniref:helix-turn-helix domain-containing protein n=1 Tax=Bacillus sp. SORGH_AS_0510 TaxID=3041771 RepID=UPI0027825E74|nr:helix-turn-helix transcriptional regulator [Bacillus sp. SORGH_AS_0510]MDQ1147039.1 DNA-binding XRE family transcriptional regulator [Bacillus sp. SORGH_AS_0510]
MKDKFCSGFCYDSEEELKQLLGIEEYLDMIYQKPDSRWIHEDTLSDDRIEPFAFTMGMSLFIKRKGEGLTQTELSKKLGVAVDTVSKIENGHEHLSKKVKAKIDDYLKEDDY